MLEDMPLYLMKTVGNPIFSIKAGFFQLELAGNWEHNTELKQDLREQLLEI